ncbi:MAG: hypothetical protein SV253_09710 [Halobacteria archaeon]|nr:hypothetical protein [Halobacteria archaeon]
MADEFIIGGGLFTGGGLLWLIFGGLYKTSSFQNQLGFPEETAPPTIGIPHDLGVFFADVSMAVMLLGPLVFWVVVPLLKSVVLAAGDASEE